MSFVKTVVVLTHPPGLWAQNSKKSQKNEKKGTLAVCKVGPKSKIITNRAVNRYMWLAQNQNRLGTCLDNQCSKTVFPNPVKRWSGTAVYLIRQQRFTTFANDGLAWSYNVLESIYRVNKIILEAKLLKEYPFLKSQSGPRYRVLLNSKKNTRRVLRKRLDQDTTLLRRHKVRQRVYRNP